MPALGLFLALAFSPSATDLDVRLGIRVRLSMTRPSRLLEQVSFRTNQPQRAGLIRVSDRILVGPEPTVDLFRALAFAGIETVVSVDGARPDTSAAAAVGLRYVHIPIGYDGVPQRAQDSIWKLMRQSPDKVYIHCHHGRHRGPVVAAIAWQCCGATVDQAIGLLQRAQTDRNYAGLWRDVRRFRPPPAEKPLPELRPVAGVEDLSSSMARIDRIWDRVKRLRASDWRTPADHPDLTAAQELLLLREGFRESARHTGDARLLEALGRAEEFTSKLHDAIIRTPSTTEARFRALSNSCKQCHRRWRD